MTKIAEIVDRLPLINLPDMLIATIVGSKATVARNAREKNKRKKQDSLKRQRVSTVGNWDTGK